MDQHLYESSSSEVTRLILVRHGRTQANQEGRLGSQLDIPLDETGLEQVQRTAERIKAYQPTAVYSSPQLRTRQTAQPIADAFNLDIQVQEELREYYFGEFSNLRMSDIQARYPQFYTQVRRWLDMGAEDAPPRPVFKDAESMSLFSRRVDKFTNQIVKKHPGECVVAVTHLGVIKALFTRITGGDIVNEHSAFLADNASISVVDFYNGLPVIRVFNEIAHLGMPLKYGRIVII